MADNDWQQQMAMNGLVFEALASNGEDLSNGRHVIHYFYGGDVESDGWEGSMVRQAKQD